MSTWKKIDDVGKNIESEPWSLYWNEMKSTDLEFQEFLRDPLSALNGDLSQVDASWNVQTHIIGHEIGFSIDAVCTIALVDRPRKTVFLTLYKYPVP